MVAFRDAITASMGLWFGDEVADTIAYTPGGGTPAQIPALIDLGENLENQQWRNGARAGGVLEVRVADVPDPRYGDLVAFGGHDWTVMRVLAGDGYTWRLEIERDARPTFSQ